MSDIGRIMGEIGPKGIAAGSAVSALEARIKKYEDFVAGIKELSVNRLRFGPLWLDYKLNELIEDLEA